MSVDDLTLRVPLRFVNSDASPFAFRFGCWLLAGQDAGLGFMSQEEFAVEMGCARGTITRCIRELSDLGWLRIDYRPGGRREYVFTVGPEK